MALLRELDPQPFRRHRERSALIHEDWNAFRDRDSVIDRGYIRLQNEQEAYTEGLVGQYSEQGHDRQLSARWLATLARWYTPARHGRHALQMAAAHGGQIAPAGTITGCFFSQSADEARLLQRIWYRTAELRHHCPAHGFGSGERERWEVDPIWQGFRELLEKTLVAWDWGECFVALNLVAKPAYDQATLWQLARAATRNGDELLHLLSEAHRRDVVRSRRWTATLIDMVAEREQNRAVIQGWLDRWVPLADRAIASYLRGLPNVDLETATRDARAACLDFRLSLGFR